VGGRRQTATPLEGRIALATDVVGDDVPQAEDA
jgi:hypothetical protein